MRLKEAGIIEFWKQKYWPRAMQCESTSGQRPITLVEICAALYIMGGLLVLAGVVLCLELCWERLEGRMEKLKAK